MRKFADCVACAILSDQAGTLGARLVALEVEPDLSTLAELLVATGGRVERLA